MYVFNNMFKFGPLPPNGGFKTWFLRFIFMFSRLFDALLDPHLGAGGLLISA